jgi:hypothetical protein
MSHQCQAPVVNLGRQYYLSLGLGSPSSASQIYSLVSSLHHQFTILSFSWLLQEEDIVKESLTKLLDKFYQIMSSGCQKDRQQRRVSHCTLYHTQFHKIPFLLSSPQSLWLYCEVKICLPFLPQNTQPVSFSHE